MNKFFELGEKLNIEKIAKVLFENQKLRLSNNTFAIFSILSFSPNSKNLFIF
jgi:hypothetical protein